VISLLLPCLIIAIASVPMILKLVPPNGFYGLRTPKTLANTDLWFRANRFAGCALFIAAATSAAVFLAVPEYAAGRSLVGVLILVVPLITAVVASLVYVHNQP
jgi:uncharacterized membrane protein